MTFITPCWVRYLLKASSQSFVFLCPMPTNLHKRRWRLCLSQYRRYSRVLLYGLVPSVTSINTDTYFQIQINWSPHSSSILARIASGTRRVLHPGRVGELRELYLQRYSMHWSYIYLLIFLYSTLWYLDTQAFVHSGEYNLFIGKRRTGIYRELRNCRGLRNPSRSELRNVHSPSNT